MVDTLDVTTLTTRERISYFLNDHPDLLAIGLPADGVLQADTANSPTIRPFIVVRWLDTAASLGPVSKRPFDLWGYDEEGDYTRIETILKRAAELLTDETTTPLKTQTGVISQISDRESGYGRGADLYDDGYKALVIPWRFFAIATGL